MNSEIAAIVELAKTLPLRSPVTIVCADALYGRILANWINHARAVGTENILVVALDRQTLEAARARSIPSAPLTGMVSRTQLWTRRAEMFAALAAGGIDFIHTDADAVWLRSPIHEVYGLGVDVAFSQGTLLPRDVAKQWGFVVCCGFFGVRAGRAAAAFFTTVVERAKSDNDDQAAVNRVLLLNDTRWRSHEPGEERTWKGHSFRVFDKPLFGNCKRLRIALLPHAKFPRLPEVSPRAVVAHPVLPVGDSDTPHQDREALLRRLGLWGLPALPAMA